MNIKSVKSMRYDVIVFESFEYKGQKRHKAHRVGSATTPPKGGLVLYIPAGIAITGRVLVVPEKTPLNEVDLLEAYDCAADAHGL